VVKNQPSFRDLWPELASHFRGVNYLVAHNARFDQGVLAACCQTAGTEMPALPFMCTMKLARHLWGIRPTKLPDVCRYFGIPLHHHDASSDSEACARIMIQAAPHLAQRGAAATE